MSTLRYETRYCTACNSLCTMYMQGIACECAAAWETERIYEKDYPPEWVLCEVRIAWGEDYDPNKEQP